MKFLEFAKSRPWYEMVMAHIATGGTVALHDQFPEEGIEGMDADGEVSYECPDRAVLDGKPVTGRVFLTDCAAGYWHVTNMAPPEALPAIAKSKLRMQFLQERLGSIFGPQMVEALQAGNVEIVDVTTPDELQKLLRILSGQMTHEDSPDTNTDNLEH